MKEAEWLGLLGQLKEERVFVNNMLVQGSSIPEKRMKCGGGKKKLNECRKWSI